MPLEALDDPYFLLLQEVSQSLAGRCAILHLLSLSFSELEGRKPLPASELGRIVPRSRKHALPDPLVVMFQGFHPRIHDKGLAPRQWLRGYVVGTVSALAVGSSCRLDDPSLDAERSHWIAAYVTPPASRRLIL